MNRNLYIFGIFFLGLHILTGIFQAFIQTRFGQGMFNQESFLHWFIILYLVILVGSVILLKYFHHKKYWITFSAGTIAIVASLCFAVIVYNMLAFKELRSYYIPAYYIVLVTSIFFSASLIFSKASKRPLLRVAGIYGFILDLILIITFIITINSQEALFKSTSETIHRWTSYVGVFFFVLLIMNFLSELKELKVDYENRILQNRLRELIVFVGVIALSSTLYFGFKLAKESYNSSRKSEYWKNQNFEKAKMMASLFEAYKYVNPEGKTLPYRLLKPLDYNPEKKYPLVVCLHDGGVHGSDNIKQLSCPPTPILSQEVNRKKYPAFLFVPHCPEGASWSHNPYYPSMDSLVFEAIYELEKEFNIDTKRRYVVGGSGGGYGSWHFICSQPEMFAAAIPVCGGGNPDLALRIVDVHVWAFHGMKDRAVPVKKSRDMIEAMRAAGGNPKYTEFPNGVHNVWPQVLKTQGVWDWLFAQKRD